MTDEENDGALRRLGRNLIEACGFDGYRQTNELRADDQKVRTLVSEILGRARQAVVAAEGDFRRTRIPAPSRAQPFPPGNVMADARRLEALAQRIGAVEGQVRHAEVPGIDGTSRRYRSEASTLEQLIDVDRLIVGHADVLRAGVVDRPPDELLASLTTIDEHLLAMSRALTDRSMMIL